MIEFDYRGIGETAHDLQNNQTGKQKKTKPSRFSKTKKAVGVVAATTALLGTADVANYAIDSRSVPPVNILELSPVRGFAVGERIDTGKINDYYNQLISNYTVGGEFIEKKASLLPSFLNTAQIWSLSRVIEASYTRTLLPDGDKYKADYNNLLPVLNKYWDSGPKGFDPGYDVAVNGSFFKKNERYTDDNGWIGKILERDYRRFGHKESLDKSREVFKMIVGQWDNNGGGIFWNVQFPGETGHDRALISAENAIELGAKLYIDTGDKSYANWAEKIYSWANKTLRDPRDGRYFDHITGNTTDHTKQSYNSMIGAMVALNEVDPQKYPLKDAVNQATKELTHYENGDYAGSDTFNAVDFQHMMELASKVKDASLTTRIATDLLQQVQGANDNSNTLYESAGLTHMIMLAGIPPSNWSDLS